MTRGEAYEHIAEVMAEWFPNPAYTPEQIAEQFALLEKNAKFVGTEMWYPKFAREVLQRAGIVE